MEYLLEQLKKTIQAHGLLKTGDTIVVAVSGGPDSVALLHALTRLRQEFEYTIAAAHVNHQFRGEEADEDCDYVQHLCQELAIPCFVDSIDVPKLIGETGLNPQDAARQVRYRFLKQVAGKMGGAKVATAHHADDQLETMVMRFVRGTGVEGLAGIPLCRSEENIDIIRPLLEVTRDQIEKYCEEQGLLPRQDASNWSDKYLRNRIRRHWIPLMREENPYVASAAVHLAEVLREENDYMRQESMEKLALIIEKQNENTIIIRQNDFLMHHLALQRRMIKLILSYLLKSDIKEIGYVHIENIRQIIGDTHPAACTHLPGGVQVHREYQRVIFSFSSNIISIPPYIYSLDIPGQTYISEIGRVIRCYYGDRDERKRLAEGTFAMFDPASVKGKLYVRRRRAGDRMVPLGMHGSKKVKDIFIDKKIPRQQRDQIPLLMDDEHVLWIPGVRRSRWHVPKKEADVVLYVVLESSLL
ncbi:tRNA(Ile)-lysidine synthetase [Aneurinibacillus aneurinilyticus ATCC 12856]|uniref:tRNA(Ile)-lysidine synthase n=1 Tax=Aneurinibacillus aneurinilyticus ATCC 12856 TaxID=649747 RepID=U1X2J6_ANEAE|nr:tRNA(Ile)-lysidine synthetase [Aneurinibacillus aneurinilyticus ATCC 12856]